MSSPKKKTETNFRAPHGYSPPRRGRRRRRRRHRLSGRRRKRCCTVTTTVVEHVARFKHLGKKEMHLCRGHRRHCRRGGRKRSSSSGCIRACRETVRGTASLSIRHEVSAWHRGGLFFVGVGGGGGRRVRVDTSLLPECEVREVEKLRLYPRRQTPPMTCSSDQSAITAACYQAPAVLTEGSHPGTRRRSGHKVEKHIKNRENGNWFHYDPVKRDSCFTSQVRKVACAC